MPYSIGFEQDRHSIYYRFSLQSKHNYDPLYHQNQK